jgi:hypothetical protein
MRMKKELAAKERKERKEEDRRVRVRGGGAVLLHVLLHVHPLQSRLAGSGGSVVDWGYGSDLIGAVG